MINDIRDGNCKAEKKGLPTQLTEMEEGQLFGYSLFELTSKSTKWFKPPMPSNGEIWTRGAMTSRRRSCVSSRTAARSACWAIPTRIRTAPTRSGTTYSTSSRRLRRSRAARASSNLQPI